MLQHDLPYPRDIAGTLVRLTLELLDKLHTPRWHQHIHILERLQRQPTWFRFARE